eukprot:851467-Rhodomonas_salina.2
MEPRVHGIHHFSRQRQIWAVLRTVCCATRPCVTRPASSCPHAMSMNQHPHKRPAHRRNARHGT